MNLRIVSVALVFGVLATQAQAETDFESCRSQIRRDYAYASKSRWVKLTFDARNLDKLKQCVSDRREQRRRPAGTSSTH